MAHKHFCLNCDRIVAEGDFDCEFDRDHDFELCDSCANARVAANAREEKEMETKILNSIKEAVPGFYVIYEQPAEETGLDVSTLVYVGPFDTIQNAENYDDGPCKRQGITEVKN